MPKKNLVTRLVRFYTKILLAAGAFWPSPQAQAVTTNWIANTGEFTTPANWDNGVPNSDDTAVFNRGAGVAYHVSFPGGAIFDPPLTYAIDSLRVHSNEITFSDISSPFTTRPSLTVANPGLSIVVGQDAGDAAVLNTSLIRLSGATTSIGRAAGADGTLNVSAGAFSISNLHVGDSGTGALTIQNGGSATSVLCSIGDQPGSNGITTVTGPASTWSNSDTLSVGNFGTGTLTIEDGGGVVSVRSIVGASTGSTGMATVTGTGSTWTTNGLLNIGARGTGKLTIESGGGVDSNSSVIGEHPGSTGTATVTGAGSTWTNNIGLVVGSSGTGALTIESGGSVAGPSGLIGQVTGSSGTVTVSGTGSTWTNNGVKVGDFGTGVLEIKNGGSVSGLNGIIGSGNGSVGTVDIWGAGSIWTNNGNLTVGDLGAGTLRIADGGEVVVAGSLLANTSNYVRLEDGKLTVNQFGSDGLGALDWRSGTLRLTTASGLTIGSAGLFGASLALDAGQNLEVDNTLRIDSEAELFASGGLSAGSHINNGDLVLSSTTVNGPVANSAGANISAIGNVTFNDLVSGPGGFFGPGSVIFDGGMSPGASTAAVSFESDVVLSDNNTLHIELGGTDEYDSLLVGGAAMLGGELDVSLIDSFSPGLGSSFEILHADGAIFGAFSDVTLPGLAAGLEWDVVYSNFAVLLQGAAAGIPGDYNQDGVVDAADYVVWRKNDGTQEGYDIWRANFGRSAGSGAASRSAVPEPSAIVPLLAAWLLAPSIRLSQRSRPFSATA